MDESMPQYGPMNESSPAPEDFDINELLRLILPAFRHVMKVAGRAIISGKNVLITFFVLFLSLVYVFLPFIVKKVRDHSIPTARRLHHAAESFLTMSSFSHRASSPHQTLRRAS